MKSEEYNNKLKLNIVAGMLSQVLVIVINLLSKTLIQRSLGVEYMGMQTVFANICDLIMFVFHGSGVAVLYSLYGPIAQRNDEKIHKLYWYYHKIYRCMTAAALLLGVIAAGAIPLLIDVDIPAARVEFLYFLYLLSMLIYSRYVVLHYVLTAYQKRYVVCLVSGSLEIVFLLAEILVIMGTGSYELFLVCILLKNVCISGGLSIYVKKKYREICRKTKDRDLDRKDQKKIQTDIRDLAFCQAGNVLINNTDSILISGLISTFTSGCYSNYYFVSSGVLGIAGSFFESISAKVGSLAVTSAKEKFYDHFWKASMVGIWISGFSTTCYYLLIRDFVKLWIGEVSSLPRNVAFLTALNLYLGGMRLVTGTYRKAAGIFHNYDKMVLLRGGLNIIISIMMGKWWGLPGILVATTFSNLVTEYWYEPYRLYQYFGKSLKYEVFYQLLGAVSITLCVFFTGKCVAGINGAAWPGFFCKAMVCVTVSNIWYLVLGFLYKRLKIKIQDH